MRIAYFAPSYKRPEPSITQKHYPFVTLIVRESEAEEYRKNGNTIITCPDSAQGNLCRVRNWILDTYSKKFDCIVLLDDDCSAVCRYREGKKIKMEPDELQEFCELHSILAKDAGCFLWGVNCGHDKGSYREYTPFNFILYIGGPFQAHMKGSEIRYDEKLPLKEDYDISLQHLYKYGKLLRVNYAMYEVKQSEQAGGCATYRNGTEERKQMELLKKKWGSEIITEDQKSKRSFDHNPVLKTPLKGV